jgi:hypothetical protein
LSNTFRIARAATGNWRIWSLDSLMTDPGGPRVLMLSGDDDSRPGGRAFI